MNRVGLPHSETAGSQDIGSFPATIAANYVLLRLTLPRHPLPAFFRTILPYLFTCKSAITALAFLGVNYQNLIFYPGICLSRPKGGPDRVRTGDLIIANDALWPTELQALCIMISINASPSGSLFFWAKPKKITGPRASFLSEKKLLLPSFTL